MLRTGRPGDLHHLRRRIDADWLNFVNSVIGLFILPLGLLRWVWWRLNIWGEVVAFVAGVPLAWLVWFPLGFKDQPYWQAFLVLFVCGWAVILVATLATRPESPEVLERFYRRVRPPGFWGPVARALPDGDRAAARTEWGADLAAAGAALVFSAALVVGLGAGFGRAWDLLGVCALAAVAGGAAFTLATMRAARARRRF